MGTITRSFANNLTTGGVLKADAFNNASLNNVTALNAAIATGNMVLLSSQTASDSASISFTTGIYSTYKEYQFWFIDINPATDRADFSFNMSSDAGSSYNVTKTTTWFNSYHDEADTDNVLGYNFNRNDYVAGYGNTTSAINAIQFKFSSGNIDDGIIKLYGVKKS